jgi:hypothetical protein
MQSASHVRRGNNDRIGLALWVDIGLKTSVGFPSSIDLLAGGLKLKAIWDLIGNLAHHSAI